MSYLTLDSNYINNRSISVPLIGRVRGPYGKLWPEFFSVPVCENKEGKKKTRIHKLDVRTEQTRLIRCLLYGFTDYSGKRTKSFYVVTCDQEPEVRTATYGPEIDQSQHAKSVSHTIKASIEAFRSDYT